MNVASTRVSAETPRAAWNAALADYQAKRAIFDGDQASDAETDRLCDIAFGAQDYLLTEVRAPDADAFAAKITFMKERDLGPDEWFDAILSDVRHLLSASSPDPHMTWLRVRYALYAAYEASHDVDPNGDPAIHAALSASEAQILDTPAVSMEGLLAKALLAADLNLSPDASDAENRVIAEARRLGFVPELTA